MGSKLEKPEPEAVEDMWWAGKDFHVLTKSGKHNIYTNAVMSSMRTEVPEGGTLRVESVSLQSTLSAVGEKEE